MAKYFSPPNVVDPLAVAPQPQGRLTLTSGSPVLNATVAASANVYYSPYTGGQIGLWNGASFQPRPFTELTNVLANSSTGNAGPAAAISSACYDLFVWLDGGTPRLTRGPNWNYNATVTVTIAAPGVMTWTSHGLYSGQVIRLTTTGALPTGLAVNTDYFITVIDANTFRLSTTLANQVAGTYITTTGSQSGTHTATCSTKSRGTGAGTTELQQVLGVYVNKNAITNGPAAGYGTYVGTVLTDASGATVSMHFGGSAAGGTAGQCGVWNMYNRVNLEFMVQDSTASWNYTSSTNRPSDNSATNRVQFVRGLDEDAVTCLNTQRVSTAAGANGYGYVSIGLDSITALVSRTNNGLSQNITAAVQVSPNVAARYNGYPGSGAHYLTGMEAGDNSLASTFYGATNQAFSVSLRG